MVNMSTYQPPAIYMRKYNNDPAFFIYEYQKYKAHLAQDADLVEPRTPILRNQGSYASDGS